MVIVGSCIFISYWLLLGDESSVRFNDTLILVIWLLLKGESFIRSFYTHIFIGYPVGDNHIRIGNRT